MSFASAAGSAPARSAPRKFSPASRPSAANSCRAVRVVLRKVGNTLRSPPPRYPCRSPALSVRPDQPLTRTLRMPGRPGGGTNGLIREVNVGGDWLLPAGSAAARSANRPGVCDSFVMAGPGMPACALHSARLARNCEVVVRDVDQAQATAGGAPALGQPA